MQRDAERVSNLLSRKNSQKRDYLIPSRSRSCTDCYSKTHRHYPAGRRTNRQRMRRRRPRSSEWRSTEQDDDYCLESKNERGEGRKKESHNKGGRTNERTDGNRYLNREKKRKPTECSAVQSPLFRIFPGGFRHSLDFLPPIRLMTL